MSAMVLVYEEVSPGVGFYVEEPAPTTPEEPVWFMEYDQYWFDYLCEEEDADGLQDGDPPGDLA